MIHSKTSVAMLAVLFSSVLFLLCGCTKSSAGPNETNHNFAVNYTGGGWTAEHLNTYIVVQTPSGDSTLAVRHVTQEGLVDFGDIGSSRVTVTFADSSYQSWYLSTYMNAPGGVWTMKMSTGDSLGSADVTVMPSKGYCTRISIQWPAFGWDDLINPADSAYHYSHSVSRLDASNRFTVMAKASGPSRAYFGWLLDQPFQLHQVNHYTITPDHAAQIRALTTSRPVQELHLSAIRMPSGLFYHMYDDHSTVGKMNFVMDYAPFPASKWQIEADYRDQTDQFIYYALADQIPSTLDIPSSSIGATYNSALNRYENVALTGTADFLRFSWSTEPLTDPYCHWDVLCAPGTQAVSRPALPESLLKDLGVPDSLMVPQYAAMQDFDLENGWDAYITRLFTASKDMSAAVEGSYFYSRNMSLTNSPLPKR